MNFVQVGWILVIISGVSSNNPSKPTFVTAGQSFKIAINETVTLPCEVKNLEYHKIAWRKRDEIISAQSLMLSPGFRFKLDGYKLAGYWTRWGDGVGQFKYVDKLEDAYNLIIENVQIEDAGEYTCQINTDPRNEITHTLEIEGPEKSPNPKPFFKTFGKKFKVAENDTIILPCEVKHLGNNVIAWHKGEDVISAGDVLVTPDDRIKLVDKFNLQIKNVQTEDSGVYHCQIGTKPRQEIKHTLKVFGTSNNEELPVPPKLFFPKIGQTFRMRVNSTVVLPCIAWNFYQGEFAWRKDEDIISVDCVMMSPNPRISVDHLAHFATQIGLTGVGAPGDGITPKSYPLKIENIQIEDSGDYSCQIGTNPRQEITYTLQVIETTLTSIGQNFTVKKGDTVVFPCEVKNIGDYIPHWGILPDNLRDVEGYELYAPNIVPRDTEMKLVNGFNLQIQNVTLDHDGVYYCQIPTSPPQEARYRLTVLSK